jgi:hypothetical protein
MRNITIFKDIHSTDAPYHVSIESLFERIKNGQSKDTVELIRSTKEKKDRNELKKKLPSICFSGTFKGRNDADLLNHSGFICLDFDGFNSEDEIASFRDGIENDVYTYACFLSPSGDGLKVLVMIPQESENHKSYFKALQKYYNSPNFDKSCSNISRVCYESYDPNIFVNDFPCLWTEKFIEPKVSKKEKVVLRIDSDDEIIKKLLAWWNKKFGMIDGQKNTNLFILASAFNDFGIDQATALSTILQFDEGGKTEEITNIHRSAYKSVSTFGTKSFEDLDQIDEIVKMYSLNMSVEKISKVTKKPVHIIEEVVEKFKPGVFWTVSNKGVVTIINHKYRDFLVDNGFHKFYPSGSQNFVFIRIINNRIYNITEDIIKDFVLEFLESLEDMAVYDFYAEKTKLAKEDFLSFLPSITPKFMKDSKDCSYIYYRNCVVKVTKLGIEQIPYTDLSGVIWDKQIVERDYIESDFSDCEFKKFVSNISGGDDKRQQAMESTIGFLLHSHKPSDFCPAVILNDEMISDNPEGGTGKGIWVRGVDEMKRMIKIDGKGFSFQKSFPYQRVSADTQVLVFDDVPKNFEFERLFSVITEGLTLEKKNKDEIYIPFDDSPKIVITTNYAIKGAGNSHERRKWELEFAQHYNKDFTPLEEFGHHLFSSWSDEEWARFDNYMLSNLSKYLLDGLIESAFKNLELRKLEASTSFEFREWVTSTSDLRRYVLRADHEYLGQELLNDFAHEYPDYGMSGKIKLSHKTFYKWINLYANYQFGMPAKMFRGANGTMVRFVKKEMQKKINL